MFEINVSKNGRHYFATHERSIVNQEQCSVLFEEFTKKFPAKEGYEISVTHVKRESVTMTEELVFQMVLETIERNKPKLRGRQKWQQMS